MQKNLLFGLVLLMGLNLNAQISSFPFVETFETETECEKSCSSICTLSGGFTNVTDDDTDWIVDANGTTSSLTGPSGDNTSGSGKYLYMEGSSCFEKQAILESPVFDFSNLSNPALEFYYHMYGQSMGSISVEASDDGGATWSTPLWSISGEQQTSESDSYLKAEITLCSYAGSSNFKFRIIGTIGVDFFSDAAIDDIAVYDAPPQCIPPFSLSTANSAGTEIDLTWTDVCGTSYDWEIVAQGASQGTNVINFGNATSNGISVTGLTPLTAYDLYIRTNCAGAPVQDWAGPFGFSSGCESQLSGSYSVGSSGDADFQTIHDAIAGLFTCGVDGPVIFNIAPGTYQEQIKLFPYEGASETNTVTLSGAGADQTIITYDGSGSGVMAVELNGADYITIEDLTIRHTGSSTSWGIQLWNEADFNTIQDCIIDVNNTSSNSAGIVANGNQFTLGSTGNSMNNGLIKNVKINGGGTGIRINGSSSQVTDGNNITVEGCEISAQSTGIHFRNLNSPVATGNTIHEMPPAGSSYGIWVANSKSPIVQKNQVLGAATYAYFLSSINTSSMGAADRANVSNNMGRAFGTGDAYFLQGSDSVDLFFNTGLADDDQALWVNSSSDGYDIRNNIFISNTSEAIDLDAPTNNDDVLDYNLYYRTDGNGALAVVANQFYNSLEEWQTASSSYNANSVSDSIVFVSANDLHLSGFNLAVQGQGITIPGISDDIDGHTRPAHPYIGADEKVQCTAPTALSVDSLSETSALLSWSAPGDALGYAIEIGLRGFSPGQGQTISGLDTSLYLATGLESDTPYDFYVITESCGSADIFSNPSEPLEFRTLCGEYSPFPVFQGFENASAPEGCWIQDGFPLLFEEVTGGRRATFTGNYDCFSDTQHTARLESPSILWNEAENHLLTFDYWIEEAPTTCSTTVSPSCYDGIQNGDESGIDCGGSSCAPCSSCYGLNLTLAINVDGFPNETSWTVSDADGAIVASGGPYDRNFGLYTTGTITENISLEPGDYTFTINDSNGNGICCFYRNGSYTLTDGTGAVIASGGSFGFSESTSFCTSSIAFKPAPAFRVAYQSFGSSSPLSEKVLVDFKTPTNGWATARIPLPKLNTNAESYVVRFEGYHNAFTRIDNIHIQEEEDCLPPQIVEAIAFPLSIEGGAAYLNWDSSDADSFLVRYALEGSPHWYSFISTRQSKAETIFFDRDGNYRFEVIAICDGHLSRPSSTVRLTYSCGFPWTLTLRSPYFTGFEGSGAKPECWTLQSSSPSAWQFPEKIFDTTGLAYQPLNGDNMAAFISPTVRKDTLISPLFDVSSFSEVPVVSFAYNILEGLISSVGPSPQTAIANENLAIGRVDGIIPFFPLTSPSTIKLSGFPRDATLTESMLSSVCISLEHERYDNLDIELSCPNGQSAKIIKHFSSPQILEHLGEPFIRTDFIGRNDLTPGTPYEYCFSMESTDFGTLRDEHLSFTPSHVYTTVPSLIDGLTSEVSASYFPEGSYKPEGDFSSLEGCPLNGEWTLSVKDLDPGFEGSLFKWSLNFDPTLLDSIMNYQPTLNLLYRTAEGGEWTQLAEYSPNQNLASTWTTEEILLPSLSDYLQFAFTVTDANDQDSLDLVLDTTSNETPQRGRGILLDDFRVSEYCAPPSAICQDVTVVLDTNGQGTLLPEEIGGNSIMGCAPCSYGNNFTLTIALDSFPSETRWILTDTDGGNTIALGFYPFQPNTTVTDSFSLSGGDYVFTILDTGGDGGSYNLSDELGNTVASSGAFGVSESTTFCADGLASESISQSFFDCDDIGSTINVTYTITDFNGASDQCSATVSVEEGNALPAGWSATNIGDQGDGSDFNYSLCSADSPNNGDLTISTGGYNLLTQNADNLAFANIELCNDGGIQARIESVDGGYAGLMIRESDAPGAKMVAVYSNLTNLIRREIRTTDNGPKSSTLIQASFPYWLRLQRDGDLIRARYRSSSNGSWQTFYQAYLPMNSCVEMGLAVFTTDPNGSASATFGDIRFRNNSGGINLSAPDSLYWENAQPEVLKATIVPNPVRRTFTLQFSAALPADGTAALFNEFGQQLAQTPLREGEQSIDWDASYLPAGLYFLEVFTQDGYREVLKVVRQ